MVRRAILTVRSCPPAPLRILARVRFGMDSSPSGVRTARSAFVSSRALSRVHRGNSTEIADACSAPVGTMTSTLASASRASSRSLLRSAAVTAAEAFPLLSTDALGSRTTSTPSCSGSVRLPSMTGSSFCPTAPDSISHSRRASYRPASSAVMYSRCLLFSFSYASAAFRT